MNALELFEFITLVMFIVFLVGLAKFVTLVEAFLLELSELNSFEAIIVNVVLLYATVVVEDEVIALELTEAVILAFEVLILDV